MPRQRKIWTEDENLKELKRVVRNYNAKISRERKKLIGNEQRYEAAQLPVNASVRELKKSIKNKKELEKALSRMEHYIDTGEKFEMSKSLEKSLNATIRDYNSKIDRLTKKANKDISKIEGEIGKLKNEQKRLQKELKRSEGADKIRIESQLNINREKLSSMNDKVLENRESIAALPNKIISKEAIRAQVRSDIFREKLKEWKDKNPDAAAIDNKAIEKMVNDEMKSRRGQTRLRKAEREHITIEELRSAPTEQDLRRELGMFREFTKKGSENVVQLDTKNGTKITEWQKHQAEKLIDENNAERERQKAIWEANDDKHGRAAAGLNKETDEFDPLKLHNNSSTATDMKERLKKLLRERREGYWDNRTQLAKISYIEKMKETIGGTVAGDMLIRKLQHTSLEEFKRTLDSDENLFALLYAAEHAGPEDFDGEVEKIWNEWFDTDMNEAVDKEIERLANRMMNS